MCLNNTLVHGAIGEALKSAVALVPMLGRDD